MALGSQEVLGRRVALDCQAEQGFRAAVLAPQAAGLAVPAVAPGSQVEAQAARAEVTAAPGAATALLAVGWALQGADLAPQVEPVVSVPRVVLVLQEAQVVRAGWVAQEAAMAPQGVTAVQAAVLALPVEVGRALREVQVHLEGVPVAQEAAQVVQAEELAPQEVDSVLRAVVLVLQVAAQVALVGEQAQWVALVEQAPPVVRAVGWAVQGAVSELWGAQVVWAARGAGWDSACWAALNPPAPPRGVLQSPRRTHPCRR